VAHSLGCRLVLETLIALRGLRGWSRFVVKVFLLAPAIPVQMCVGAIADLVRSLEVSVVCFSPKDWILNTVFRLGEASANPNATSRFPEAVGLRGNPSTLWKYPHRTSVGHTQYWQTASIAKHVAVILDPSLGQEPEAHPDAEPRDFPERADAHARVIAGRLI
jgi:hypothetical protein